MGNNREAGGAKELRAQSSEQRSEGLTLRKKARRYIRHIRHIRHIRYIRHIHHIRYIRYTRYTRYLCHIR